VRTMSDFEGRVRQALGTSAEGAPAAVGLVEGARSKLRRRRTVAAVAMTTAVVLGAVPVGIALLGDSPDGGSDDVVASTLPTVPDGWRWESWHDIQLAVPANWDEGSPSQYCIGNDPSAGAIDRGDGFSTLVACEHSLGPGVVFRLGAAKEPLVDIEGVGERLSLGGNTVDVIAADQATLDAIVATAHVFDSADSRGCAPLFDADTVMSAGGSFETMADSGSLTVCQYTGTPGDDATTYDLRSSATLDDSAASVLRDAIAAAPTGSSGSCSSDSDGGEPSVVTIAVEVRTSEGRVAASVMTTCDETPLRTAAGEFDGTELMFGLGQTSGSSSGPVEVDSAEVPVE
jgi:hypothetical protein